MITRSAVIYKATVIMVAFGLAVAPPVLAQNQVNSEDFDPTPRPEVREGVQRQRGGSPELYRQTEEMLREYDRYRQYDPQVNRKTERVTLTRTNLDIPFEVEVSEGYLTTLTFLDINGTPYPVRISRVGDNQSFIVCTGSGSDCTIEEGDLDIAHILTVGTTRLAGRTNLRVFFRGLDRAVNVPLVGRTRSYHDEVIVMLPVENPDYQSSSQVRDTRLTVPETDDHYARALLDNVPASRIAGAVDLELIVEQRSGRRLPTGTYAAMYANGKTYLRTDITLPNPSAEAVTRGSMRQLVYRFNGKPRAVSGMNRDGQIIIIEMQEPENVLGYREIGRGE